MSNLFNNPDDLVDVVRQILSGKPLEEKKKEEELDPVNKQAVKKKFDDRKDKDIDNDGDVDSSDKFLHKRRKAISKALNEKEPKKKEQKPPAKRKQQAKRGRPSLKTRKKQK